MTLRAASAAATKARIQASATALYRERPIEDFTLEEVAQRAGTTVRTILRAYGSKDALFSAALHELAAGGVPAKPVAPGDGAGLVTMLFDIYETMGDLLIRQLADEPRRPALKRLLDKGRDNHRAALKEAFAPQLAARRGAARAQLLTTLVVATDVYVWKLLRRDMALSRAEAETIVRRMVAAVIGEEARDGTDAVAELVRRREPAAEPRRRARSDRARP